MGRMAIDLKKNKELLLKAYNDVVSDSSKANWVIFGYEGLTPVLKVVESGDGGIEELSEELNSGKIQYAYCRITDPNTALPKYVLINWQGEGAQDSFKLKCTAHLRDIQAFLKTVHVSINARTEADIDEDDIVKQVAKASGANYSFHKEKSKAYEAPGPVGTDYHRVIPTKDINTKSRDQFWADTEKEELKRQQEEVKRQQEANQKADQERKERELHEAKERDRRTEEHIRTVRLQKELERKANELNKEAEIAKWEKQQKDVHRDDEECRYRADQMRRERAAEVVAITSSASNARNYFQQKSVERPDAEIRKGPPPPRKLKSLFSADQQKPQEPIQREPIQLPKSEAAADFHVAADEPEPSPQSPTYQPELSTYQPESSTYLPKSLSYEPHYESETTAADAEISQTRNLLQQNVPASYKSTELEEEQNWNEPLLEDISPVHHEEQVTQRHQQQSHDRIAGGGDQGLCARALYDYQAADDTEISFDPNDIITNIDKIDEGWWQGFAPDGSYDILLTAGKSNVIIS